MVHLVAAVAHAVGAGIVTSLVVLALVGVVFLFVDHFIPARNFLGPRLGFVSPSAVSCRRALGPAHSVEFQVQNLGCYQAGSVTIGWARGTTLNRARTEARLSPAIAR